MKRVIFTILVVIQAFVIANCFSDLYADEQIQHSYYLALPIAANGMVPLKTLASSDEYIWDNKTKSATVIKNDMEYTFHINSNGTIDLIKKGIMYGTFAEDEATGNIYNELNGNLHPDIYINPAVFNKYFNGKTNSTIRIEPLQGPKYASKVKYNNNPILRKEDSKLTASAFNRIQHLQYTYGNLTDNSVPFAEAELIRILDKSVKEHGIRVIPYHNKYSISDTVEKIISLYPVLVKQSNELGVKKELISSVVFREMMCYALEDDWIGKTKGIAHVSTKWVRENEKHINKTDKFSDLSDKELEKRILNDKESIYFAAMALKTRAKEFDMPMDNPSSEQITKLFESYNGFRGYGIDIGSFSFRVTFGPIKHKKIYGMQTYEYCEAFIDYYSIVDLQFVI